MGQGMTINGSAWPSNCCGFPSITLSLWKLVKLKKNSYKLYSVIGLFVWLVVLLVFFCPFFSLQTRSKTGCCCCCCSTLFYFFILSSACLSNCTCPFVNTQVPAQWRFLPQCRHCVNFPFPIPIPFLLPSPYSPLPCVSSWASFYVGNIDWG